MSCLFSKGTKPYDNRDSDILEELTISESGSNVTFDCFAECSSYLVVYRAYGDPTLNLIHNTTFPVTISLEIGTNTFTVFEIAESSAGVNDIDDTPLLRRRVRVMQEDNNIESSETVTSTVMITVPTPTLSEPTVDGNFSSYFFLSLAHYSKHSSFTHISQFLVHGYEYRVLCIEASCSYYRCISHNN